MPHDPPGTAEQTTTTASWSILPQDSYQHPYQSGLTARTFPYAATITTVHNLLSEVIYFIARGGGFSGVLSVQDDGERGTSVLRVDVTMYYTHPHLAQCAQVYREQVWPERSCFKILTPRECGHEEMFFDVMVHLPPGASDRQWISKFESDLPQFSHVVGDLSQSIHFGQLLLRGTNGQIMSKSILTDSASMCTSNATIECDYVSARCLALKTANGTINANISLLYTGGEASTLITETSNGGITSTISLVSATADRAGGTYIIAAKTSNGPIFMSFPQSPQNSTQYIDAKTSNAPLFAKLHEAFEGEFRLRTSNGPSNVQRHQQAYDSSRGGRTRVVELGNSNMGATVGTATWGALPSGNLVLGRAIFETSNSPAQLTV